MRWQPSIRAYLLTLQAVTVLPFVALLAYAIQGRMEREKQAAHTAALGIAHVAASSVQQFLAEAESVLTEVAGWTMVRDAVRGRCDPFLGEFPKLYPKFASVLVVDAETRVQCPSESPLAVEGREVAGSEWFLRAIRSNRVVVSGPYREEPDGRWIVTLVHPVRGPGNDATGAIGLAVNLVRYRVDLERLSVPPASVIAVIDPEGTFLVRTLDASKWVGRNARDADLVRAVLAADEGAVITSGLDGVDRIYAFTIIPGLRWKVYAGIPVKTALAPARAAAFRSSFLGLFGVTALVVFSFYMGSRIVAPVRALTDTTRQIARGDLDARARVEGPSEIAEVAAAVNDMMAARARTEQELRRRELMSVMGSVVAGVAHEVRNPLFGISATLDAFEARFGQREDVRAHLDVLRREVDRMTHLMAELLEYGRPHRLELRPDRIEDALEEAIRSCGPLSRETGVNVEDRVFGPLEAVRMDRPSMVQVIRNLIENAVHFSPTGGCVRIALRRVRWNGRRCVEIEVEDAGPGFAPGEPEKIFEPFYSRRPGGTGLGLSIVKRIVEDHGGSVSASTRREGGAAVTVRIPEA